VTSAPILVAGATGTVGTELVAELVRSGHLVRALTRDPERAAERLPRGVEIVAGDLQDPASLAAALRGVAIASIATTPTPLLAAQEIAFIEAAMAAKLRRLVKLSAFGIDFARDRIHVCHADSERRLRSSGIPFVVLRPVVFMSNLMMDLASIAKGSLPSVFGESRMSFVDPRDVAALMARALVDARYEGETWEFGGPEPLTHDEVAATLTRLLGKKVEHVPLDPAEFGEQALRDGLPDFVVEAITEAAADTRRGKFVVDDSVIRRVLGRPAAPLTDWLERHRAAFV
jgi:uncharacterized protein YbjT (DUF2867 family)